MVKLSAHIQFQKRLLGTVENKFRSWKLMPQVVASYELGPLYKDFSAVLSAQQLHQYLAGKVKKKEILRTVKDKQRARGKALPLDLLTKAVQRVGGYDVPAAAGTLGAVSQGFCHLPSGFGVLPGDVPCDEPDPVAG